MFYFSGLQLHFYNWFGTNVHERNKGVGGPGEPIPSLISRWGSEHLWTPNFFMRIQAFFQKGKVLKKNSVLWNVKLFIYIFKLCVRQKTVFSLECSETHYDFFFYYFERIYIYIYLNIYIDIQRVDTTTTFKMFVTPLYQTEFHLLPNQSEKSDYNPNFGSI